MDHLIAQLKVKAVQLFEDEEKAEIWLNHKCRAFNGKTPVEMCENERGYQDASDLLMKIEHGVYS